jgi:hypothetical protein
MKWARIDKKTIVAMISTRGGNCIEISREGDRF